MKAAITVPAARVIWRWAAFTGGIIDETEGPSTSLKVLFIGPRIARAADADRGSLKEEKKSYALLNVRISSPALANLF
jgi:hypothetical protein